MKRLAPMLLLLLGVALPVPRPAAAQEQAIRRADLSWRTRSRLLRLVRDSTTRRFEGDARIPADSTIHADVLAMHGTLTVAGRVDGELLLIHGTLALEPGAAVGGDVTLIDGDVQGDAPGAIAGTLIAYGEASPDSVDRGFDAGDWREGWWGYDERWGRARLSLELGGYNRVEGLPIELGPVLTSAGPNPTRLSARGIWRTEPGADNADRFGYDVTLEQFLGGARRLRVAVGAESEVSPIEGAGLTELESSLSSLLLHTDYRDHYQHEGWRALIAWRPGPLQASLTFRSENQRSRAAGDPWSLTRGNAAWRLQPLVAEGRLETLTAGLTLDTRRTRLRYRRRSPRRAPAPGDSADDAGRAGAPAPGEGYRDRGPGHWRDPWPADREWWRNDARAGWRAALRVTRGVGGQLAIPARENLMAASPLPIPATPVPTDFTAGVLDVRRYMRVGWSSMLSLRGLLAGSMDGRELPAQYQRTLGGPGSLPGYDLFAADCGARVGEYVRAGETRDHYFGGYGCDRVALFQAEYRSGIDLDLGGWWRDHAGWRDHGRWSDEAARRERADWRDGDFDPDLGWSVFFDAGRGWALGGAGRPAALGTGTLTDAGVGVFIGDVALYWAAPLTRGSHGSKLLLRLSHRF